MQHSIATNSSEASESKLAVRRVKRRKRRNKFARTLGFLASDDSTETVDLRQMQVTERSFKIKDEVKKFTVTEPCSNLATDILPTESSD